MYQHWRLERSLLRKQNEAKVSSYACDRVIYPRSVMTRALIRTSSIDLVLSSGLKTQFLVSWKYRCGDG